MEIIENHQNLDECLSIIKHYGVSAEYISNSLIQQFEQNMEQKDADAEENKDLSQELIDDLKQFCSRF